jgi:4-amino-4-deoxy-L-arabinose transferase-like glycosyltransferase
VGPPAGRWWLPAIVLVGVALRVAWAVHATRPPVGLHDPTFYTVFADRLAGGLGYTVPGGAPTAYSPVGYPGALAGVFWLADRTPLPDDRMALVVGLNLVAAAASIVLVAAIGRRLFDRRTGLVAAAVVALMPNLVFHSALALTETLFIALALGAVLVVVRGDLGAPGLVALAGFGALTGVASLVRPPSLLFLPVLALAGRWAAGWGWRRLAGAVAVTTVAAAAVILPWTARNLRQLEAPILISSNVGDNLCIGNNPEATGEFATPASCLEGFDDLPRPESEVRRDAHGRSAALRFLRDEPAEQLRLVPLRLFHTVKSDADGLDAAESYGEDRFLDPPVRRSLGVLANVTWFATLALGSAALVVVRSGAHRRDPARTFLALAGLSLALPPLAFFGDIRFHVPVVPFLALGAAALLTRWGARRQPVAT